MNVKDCCEFLAIAHASRTSVILRGNHGIGKSAIVKMYHDQMQRKTGQDWGFVDIRLSQQDVGDLRGIPFRVGGATFFAPPLWLPVHPDYQQRLGHWLGALEETYQPFERHAHGVLFLDEFNRATREVLQCAFELVLDRRLGGVPIPEGWTVVAAINADADLYEVQRLDAALLNRFAVIDFTPSPEDWFQWAGPRMQEGLFHPAVYQYLRRMENKLDPEKEDILKAVQEEQPLKTRRSWSRLAEFLATALRHGQDYTRLDTHRDEARFLEVATGFLGTSQAAAFLNFIKTEFKVLQPRAVIDHWSPALAAELSALAQAERPTELLGLGKGIIDELKQRPAELPRPVQENLLAFIQLVPNEIAMDFFTLWCRVRKDQVDLVYHMTLRDEQGKTSQPFKMRIFEVASRKAAVAL